MHEVRGIDFLVTSELGDKSDLGRREERLQLPSPTQANNGGVATAGIVLGVISIIAGLAFIAIWVGLFKEVGAGVYIDCLQRAGEDRAAVQQCSDEFRQSVSERLSRAPTPTR
jgi:hypothetical protein